MQPAFDHASRKNPPMIPSRIADPARGIGQALRTIYIPSKTETPQDFLALLDRLDIAGSDRA